MKVTERKPPKRQAVPVDGETRSLLGVVRRANRQQRFFNAALLIGLLCIALAALLLFQRNTAQDDAIVNLVGSLRETCEQADDGTLAADTQDDCDRVENGQVPIVVEQLGQTGATGARGAEGLPGAPGESPPCLDTPAMCVGADGQPGGMGLPGTNGVDGQSPPCLDNPSMCQGADGSNGVNGANGEPPLGWSTARSDGSIETCERAEDFDPANPRYACSVSAGPANDGVTIP